MPSDSRPAVRNPVWVLIAAILGSAMTFIDGSAVNVALPIVQRDLHATLAQMQWVIEGYALFLSALILIGGSLGDVLGRKRMFVIGVVVFATASLGCALAPDASVLIAARCLQGIGAALAVPESLALISAAYDGEARGKSIGLWSGFAAITAAGGPVLGGWLAQAFSWRWVFLINVPLAIATVAIAVLLVGESRDEEIDRRIDWGGAALATAGLGALTFGLIDAGNGHPGALAFGCLFTGTAVLALFVWWERRAAAPMMPLDLFRSRPFSVANVYTLALYAALGGSLYFLPFQLQNVRGYEPAAAGAAFLPFILLQFGFSRWSGGLVARVGARVPLVAGAAIAGAAFAVFALPGLSGSYWVTYFPAVLLLGIGGVLFVAPLTTTVFDSSPKERGGVASGINNAVSRTAGLLAVAALGIVLTSVFDRGFDAHLARQHLSDATRRVVDADRGMLTAGRVPDGVPPADRVAVKQAVNESFLAGFRAVMLVSAATCWLAALVALAGIPARGKRAPHAAPSGG